jgi:hypothetical protein
MQANFRRLHLSFQLLPTVKSNNKIFIRLFLIDFSGNIKYIKTSIGHVLPDPKEVEMRNTDAIVISLITVLLVVEIAAAEPAHLYKIRFPADRSAKELVEAGIPVFTVIPEEYALAELTNQQLTKVIRMGYAADYIAESLVEYSASDQTDDYYDYNSLTSQLQTWADENADIAVLYDLGTTVGNRHVWAMKVSDNPMEEEDEIVCYYVGCHHGNEKISEEIPMYFLGYLFDNYGVDPNVTYWVENREIWVLPLLNPDGFSNNNRYNSNGVDLNRNYSFHWGESAYAYGPYPFSEVETQAVRDLNLAHHFTTSHSYHSYGEIILYPFAWASNRPSPDNAFYEEIVWAMAAANGYDPLLSGNLYPHGGEHNDYLYGEKGVMAVTTELWGGPGYNPPSSQIIEVFQDNLPNDLYLLERSGGAQITGLVTDASSGDPLVAQVKVVELWDPDEIYPRYSEPEYGRYRHLVVPGTYTLEVSKTGYLTQTIPNINVVNGQPTVVNVALVYQGYPDVSITMTPINPPIIIPATGGTFEYDITVSNGSGQTQVADVWIDVTLPDGTVYGPLALRDDLNMSPNFYAERILSQYVPLPAPEGQYTMNGYVGNYDLNEVWDEDHFTFMKVCLRGEAVAYLPQVEGFDLTDSGNFVSTTSETFQVRIGPNPFNPTTVIGYQLQIAGFVNLSVYDITGRKIADLVNGWKDEGVHRTTFDASGLATGVYIYRLMAGEYTASGKMVLMK